MREITSMLILIAFTAVMGFSGWYDTHDIRKGEIVGHVTIEEETLYTVRDEYGHLYDFFADVGDYYIGQSVKVTLHTNYTDQPDDDIVEKVI